MQESYLTHGHGMAQRRRVGSVLELLEAQQALCATGCQHACCVEQQQQQQHVQQPPIAGKLLHASQVAVVRAEQQRLQVLLQQLEHQGQRIQEGKGQSVEWQQQQQQQQQDQGEKLEALLPHTPPHPLKLAEARSALYISHAACGHICIPKCVFLDGCDDACGMCSMGIAVVACLLGALVHAFLYTFCSASPCRWECTGCNKAVACDFIAAGLFPGKAFPCRPHLRCALICRS